MKFFKKSFNKNLFILLIGDILLVSIAMYTSLLFRFDFNIPLKIHNYFSLNNLVIIMLIKVFWYKFFGLYQGMWRYTSIWDMINIIMANIFSSGFLIGFVYFLHGFQNLGRSFLAIDFIICTGLISISRLGIRVFFSHLKNFLINKKSNFVEKKVIIIGAGFTGNLISKQAYQKSNLAIRIVGFLDDDENKVNRKINGIPIIGKISQLSFLKFNYDEIYICVPSATRNEMKIIVDECKKTGKPFKTLPSISGLMEGKVSISQMREVSLVDLLGREEIILYKGLIKNFIHGKRVLVTGAGGSIGSELVRQCVNYEPSLLIMIDISELNLFQIDRESKNFNSSILFKPILLDIKDEITLNSFFEEYKPQVVFHAAAYKHVPIQEHFPQEAIKTNIFGSMALAEASLNHRVEKFVLVSTDKAVKPANVMGATKRLAEIVIKNFNQKNNITDFITVRFGNVLGSSGSVIPIFQEQIQKGGPVTITDPEMKRYFMSIPEASQLILQAGSLGSGGEVFILDMGDPIKIIDIAKELIRLSGYEPELDIDLEITGSRPGEKKYEELSLPSESLDKTKHNKIFVLDSKGDEMSNLSYMISKIENLKISLNGKSANDIRQMLSSILPEYKPEIKPKNISFIKRKAEA